MAEATLIYIRPDGRAPLIGDVDNGRLHWLTPELADAHRSFLGLAAVATGRADFRAAAGRARAEGFWWGEMPAPRDSEAKLPSKLFDAAGLAVLRSEETHVVVHCGAPRGPRGHFHNDCLSFEASLMNLPWILDPGTYAYTSSEADRNHFRGTAAHNTLQVDQTEINAILPGQLFDLAFASSPRVVEWTSTQERDCFVGEHEGFARIPGVGRHRRRIALDKATGGIEIEDSVSGEGAHTIEMYLHLDPGVRAVISGSRVTLTRPAAPRAVEVGFCFPEDNGSLTLAEDWVSRGYGKREQGGVIRAVARVTLPWKHKIVISVRP
jgi:hypothetical protein